MDRNTLERKRGNWRKLKKRNTMKRGSETGWRPLTRIGRLRIGLLLGWLFVYLVLLLTGGCTQTEVEEDVIPPHALKDVEAGFNLHVLANQTPVTRSITFTPEGTIEPIRWLRLPAIRSGHGLPLRCRRYRKIRSPVCGSDSTTLRRVPGCLASISLR